MVRDALQDQDRVAIVTFSDKAKVRLPLSHPKDESISAVIDSLKTVHPLYFLSFSFSLCSFLYLFVPSFFAPLRFVLFCFSSSFPHLNLFSLANHLFIYIYCRKDQRTSWMVCQKDLIWC